MPSPSIKLSAPETKGFWEIPVVYEDEHMLALNKPACLLTSPDRYDPQKPNIIRLMHEAITAGKPWARDRGLTYLMNAHRLDFETSGILLVAKTKPMLVALANLFGSEQPVKTYVAMVHGAPEQAEWEVDAPIAMHQQKIGYMRVDIKEGKRSRTRFRLLERFHGISLVECQPLTDRTHQIRVHLKYSNVPICGDSLYGGGALLLSQLKNEYRLKPGKTERPLINTVALHAEKIELVHPVTSQTVSISAERPKDFNVALKFLRLYARGSAGVG